MLLALTLFWSHRSVGRRRLCKWSAQTDGRPCWWHSTQPTEKSTDPE